MGEERERNIKSTSEEEDAPSSKGNLRKSLDKRGIGLYKGNYQPKSSVMDLNSSNADENGKGRFSKGEVREKMEEWEREREARALAKECLANEYNLYKTKEYTFQTEIQPLISVFHRILDELIYFAGCQTEANYEGRKTILLNKQELLRDVIQNRTRGQGISFEGIDRMKQVLEKIESCHVDRNTTATGKQERTGPKTAKIVDAEEKIEKYITENKKLRMDEIRQRQCLEYACLLKAFYPIVEEICGQETMDAQWAGGIAKRLEKVVENQPCKFSKNMKFCWVYPDDDVVKQSEQLQLQFRAAEVDCPGLYYRDSSRQDQYVCVVPGCVK